MRKPLRRSVEQIQSFGVSSRRSTSSVFPHMSTWSRSASHSARRAQHDHRELDLVAMPRFQKEPAYLEVEGPGIFRNKRLEPNRKAICNRPGIRLAKELLHAFASTAAGAARESKKCGVQFGDDFVPSRRAHVQPVALRHSLQRTRSNRSPCPNSNSSASGSSSPPSARPGPAGGRWRRTCS
jgi:hypothetical protein